MTSIGTIKSFINELIGKQSQFNLEERILNTVLIVVLCAVSINSIINVALGLYIYALLMAMCFILFATAYYLSRYQKRLILSVHILAIVSNFLCLVTYYGANASSGSNLMTMMVIMFIISIIAPKKIWRIWVPITYLHIIILFYFEYHNPHWVKNIYDSPKLRILDIAQTWLLSSALIAVLTVFIKYHYHTEKRLAESRLKALLQMNNHKNKLFSIISHDLRAPLTSIENYLINLNKTDISLEEKLVLEHNLLQNTRQTSLLLQNILQWSKDQMSGTLVNIQTIKYFETINPSLTLCAISAQEKDIKINVNIDEDIQVISDANLLQIIFRNLLNNAIKFSFPGETIQVIVTTSDEKAHLKIIDTGIGIEENVAKYLFDIKSGSKQGTQKEQGIGLGLLLAINYTEMLGGEISFEKNTPKGTIFTLNLPLG